MRTLHKSKLGWVIALMAVVLAGWLVAIAADTPAKAQGAQEEGSGPLNSATISVEFADGTSSAQTITWTVPISGATALEIAGFEVEHNGDTICSIAGDGCPADDCFCADNWWWQGRWLADAWDGSEWPPANLVDGDVIGFRNRPFDWGPPKVPGPAYAAVGKGFQWLGPLQSATDGSHSTAFGGMGSTADMVLAVVANRGDPADWRRGPTSPSLTDYIQGANAADYADTDASAAGKLAVTLAAMPSSAADPAICWPAMGAQVMDYYHPETGTFYEGKVEQAGAQSWAILGMTALSQTIPVTAVNALLDMANPDGGWAYHSGWGGSDTMATAQSIQALVAAGVPTGTASIQNGLAFLKAHQNADGGFVYEAPGGSDVDATAFAVQAIVAAGQDPFSGTWTILNETERADPIRYLAAVQSPDGSFPAFSPMMASQHALLALLRRPFPLAVHPVPACPTWTVHLPLIARDAQP